MFQSGKEVHEPGKPVNRRPSGTGIVDAVRKSSVSSTDGLEKTTSNDAGSPTSQRRRSSNTGLFGNLTSMKRGSEDYGDRRSGHSEHMPNGALSGWYNSTFRGMTGAKAPTETTQENQKRGVME